MKPHLPLTLLSVLLMLGASLAPAATIVNPSPAEFPGYVGGGISYSDNELIVNTAVSVPESRYIGWNVQAGSNTLSGSGSVNAIPDAEGYTDSGFEIWNWNGDKCSVSVNGVAFNGMGIGIDNVDVVFNNTMKDSDLAVCHESVVDLTNAKMSGERTYFEFSENATNGSPCVMLPPGGTLNLSPSGMMLGVGDNGIIRGNVNLSGSGNVPYTVTKLSELPQIEFYSMGGVYNEVTGFYVPGSSKGWGTLNIEGALTLGSAAAISFSNETGNAADTDSADAHPNTGHPVIICRSLSGSLKRLMPYMSVWVEADDSEHYIRLTNYGFRAEKGADGRIYIYLTPASELPPEEEAVTESAVTHEPSADTMWASRDIVRSFAQTAEGQMIIGTPGQTTVWGAALGSFVHMSRSTGFVAENGGGAIGVQHAFTEQFRAGAAFGQTFGSFRTKESYMNADQRGTMFGAVAQYVGREQNGVSASLNGHIAIGSVRNEAKFNSDFSGCGKSSWDDRVLSLGTRASLWMTPSTDVTLVPFIGLEYQRVIQGHHTESDGTYSVRYSGGAMQTLSLPVGVTLRTQCTLPEGETLVPEITLAYEGDVVRQNPHVTVRETGATGRCKGTGSKPGRSALRLDAGVNLLIDAQWSVGAFYHLEARKDATSHSCNAAVRYSF